MQQDDQDIISEINVIPLVDVSLVLLIIFMVTANYLTFSYVKINLPKSTSGEALQPMKDLTVVITQEGPLYLENVLVTKKELKTKIKKMYDSDKNIGVVLNVDERTDFKNVVEILDILRDLGISNLNITTIDEKNKS